MFYFNIGALRGWAIKSPWSYNTEMTQEPPTNMVAVSQFIMLAAVIKVKYSWVVRKK